MHLRAWLLLALGCGTSDAQRYHRAISAGGDGLELCAGISDADARGDCTSYTGGLAAADGRADAALEACGALTDATPWRSECFFQAADGAALTGKAARFACTEAGNYADRCLDHATTRALTAMMDGNTVGEETANLARATTVAVEMVGEARGKTHARKAVAEAIAARQGSFSLAICGDANATVCQLAYRVRIRRAVHRDRSSVQALQRTACQRPLTLDEVPPELAWEPDAAELVQAAWSAGCR